MHSARKVCIFTALALLLMLGLLRAADFNSFQGEVNSSNINLRVDATVYSEIISQLNRHDQLEVVAQLYEWYKVRLPKTIGVFIKKDFILSVDEKSGKILGNNVNVRLRPDDSAPIVGILKQEEIVNILGSQGSWCKIGAVDNSFGWVHKKFVDTAKAPDEKE
jgi:uncharacterized protein YgiM (DUF1202 family)